MKKQLLEYFLYPPHKLNRHALSNCIRGKTILITGASYGIGEAVAYNLGNNGVTLILVARSKEKLQAIQKDLKKRNATVYIFCCDLYNLEETEQLIKYIQQLDIPIDIFINNAGKSICRSIEDSLLRFSDFTRTMSINYFSPVKILLSLIPQLKEQKGHIISISAINVLFAPAPQWAAYQASKSAMDHWIRSVLPELEAEGIAVTSIYLPLVKTRMIAPTLIYRNAPAMSPTDAANIICKSILKRNARWKPWWTIFPQLGSLLFRTQWEIVATYYKKKSREKPE